MLIASRPVRYLGFVQNLLEKLECQQVWSSSDLLFFVMGLNLF